MQVKNQFFGSWALYLSFGTCYERNYHFLKKTFSSYIIEQPRCAFSFHLIIHVLMPHQSKAMLIKSYAIVLDLCKIT